MQAEADRLADAPVYDSRPKQAAIEKQAEFRKYEDGLTVSRIAEPLTDESYSRESVGDSGLVEGRTGLAFTFDEILRIVDLD